ncbi:MAG: VWA domain-containing protein [Opitutaceae bacterium]|nr:VWA domain-containing protein [Opitutaceae bacterium]
MSFAWPHLLLLVILPAGFLLWELFHRVKAGTAFHPKILEGEAGSGTLHLRGTGAKRRQRARIWLWLGLMFAVVALARPQWGRIEEPVFDQSREILITVDLSRSMLVQDIKPSRLDRAKLLISSLLEKLEGERVGLIVFSGTAFLQSPLSADYEILREFLPALDADYMPEGGTNYRALLDTALEAFSASSSADRFLITLSDGETTDETWKESLRALQERNIRAICLGIGTAAGAMIPDGTGAFVKDERGAVVLSRLESTTLQELAKSTQGVYRDASGWIDLAGLINETVETGRKGEFVEKNTVRLVERYQWALAPALVCLLLSFWLEFPVRPRPRDLKLAGANLAGLGLVAALSVLSSPPLNAAANTTPELSTLGKIVSRLSTQSATSGRDWAELARETVTWGQKLQTEQHPVPEGPVRDALQAVELGSSLDAQTADWTQLRSELEALLQKPEPPPEQEQPQDQNQDDQSQKQDQQNQSQSQKDKSSENQPQDQSQQEPQDSRSGESQENQSDSAQPQNPGEQSDQQNQQSAFGDMNEKAPPPDPSQRPMQQVGGAPTESAENKEGTDPALAMPLQKLQKVRDKDSPAELFQLMEGKPEKPAANKGKNW